MGPDRERLSEILRRLTPQQEKVVRLSFGLGCKRSHSAVEMAEEFGVSSAVIAGILGAAKKELAKAGITTQGLKAAASKVITARPNQSPPPAPKARITGPENYQSAGDSFCERLFFTS